MARMASYASLLDISRQMLELAKQQEWESLARAQEQRDKLIAAISSDPTTLAPSEISTIAATIRQIQDFDREVLEYVTPWREHAAILLPRLEPQHDPA